jgi:hypothetical protein
VENYEEDSFEIEDDEEDVDDDLLEHNQLAAKESTPSEAGEVLSEILCQLFELPLRDEMSR